MILDIHKLIGKLPRPKKGFVAPNYKYLGPYNPLDSQLEHDNTGKITKFYDQPLNKVDEIAANHDVCYKVGIKNKNECDREMVKNLDNLNPNEMTKWGKLARLIINSKQKFGFGFEKLANELHKPIIRNFKRRKVNFGNEPNEIWSADLIDLKKLKKYNNGFQYIINIIDLYSRYAWSIPIKNKTGKSIVEAFNSTITQQQQKPKKLWVDNGSEFYNKIFKKWLNDNNIEMYSTFNEGKAVVIERFNRTLKNKMFKYFTANGTYKYIDILSSLINEYNNKKHSSTKLSPKSKYFNKQLSEDKKINKKNNNLLPLSYDFKIGDKVRISKFKKKFEKGYTPNWTDEIFTIYAINMTNPVTYLIKDLNNNVIKGSFYKQELQKTTGQEIFRISKIIKKKNKNAFVSWEGYVPEFNSWIPISSIKNFRQKKNNR